MSVLPSVSTQQESFFPSERSAEILAHMNSDHADAVLRYARHFGGRADATAARLTGIDQAGIDLAVTTPAGESPLRVAFEKPLSTPDDAQPVLIAMARTASTFERAHKAVDELRAGLSTAILGTLSASGLPDASVAPVVLSADGVPHTYVSELSIHTRNLRETGRASLLVIEDESAASHPLGRRRLTLACTAAFIERGSPVFETVIEALKEKFGPVMQHLAGLADFHVVRLTPQSGRLVSGFGQAFEVDPLDWSRLTHVRGVEGKGHAAARKS